MQDNQQHQELEEHNMAFFGKTSPSEDELT